MNKRQKETINIRFTSTAFMIMAIAIFKPFGLEGGQWQSYLHLICLFVLGLFSCFTTEVILRYMLHMPRSYERGINYIISRNLRFQIINTPLVALFICLYRHFMMSHLLKSNQLSLSNYLETLAIIAFLRYRTLLALQVPQQVSDDGIGRDNAAERRTEEDARIGAFIAGRSRES